MYDIIICDDDDKFCTELESVLKYIANKNNIIMNIDIWNSGEKLFEHLKSGNRVDLIFLDIELLEGNGIDIGNAVRETLNDFYTAIVYVSYEESYAMSLFRSRPYDFLVKPIGEKAVEDVINRYIKEACLRNLQFTYKKEGGYRRIPFNEILYFRSMNRKVIMKMINHEDEFYLKLSDIERQLPPYFIRVHKSYIINQNHVKSYNYEAIEMINGENIGITKPYRNAVQESLYRKMKGCL